MIPEGFEDIGQRGTWLAHVGGLCWRRLEHGTQTCLLLQPRHLNPNGVAHGGLLMTLLDITLGTSAQTALPDTARHPATVSLSANLMASARGGHWLYGEGRVDSSSRTMTFVSGRLHSEGRAVLTGSAVFRNPAMEAR